MMQPGFTTVAALAPTHDGHRRAVVAAEGKAIVRPRLLA